MDTWDFPGGPVVKNPPSNAGDTGSIPGRGTKIPHAAGQLSPHATTREPAHHNYRAHAPQLESLRTATTEPAHSGACAPQLKRSPCTATKDPMCCNKRSRVPQPRPNAAKNKYFLKMDI